MAVTRISDVVVPEEFTAYVVQSSMTSSALVQSGVAARNGVIENQLTAGAQAFTVPWWTDLGDTEADIVSDDPDVEAVPRKLGTDKMLVRKSYLHAAWSAMNLASELAGDDAVARIKERAGAFWQRQMQRRLIAGLIGIHADNVASNSGDMVLDISGLTGAAAVFDAEAVIDAAGTLGDAMQSLSGIAMHSATYRLALKADLIDYLPDSLGNSIATYRGMGVIVDDGLPVSSGTYTTILFGAGAVGWGMAAPRIADGTEIENKPGAGNGGGSRYCTRGSAPPCTRRGSPGSRVPLRRIALPWPSWPSRRTGTVWWSGRRCAWHS